jgi:Spy/CpxP family protein refolding chaperone
MAEMVSVKSVAWLASLLAAVSLLLAPTPAFAQPKEGGDKKAKIEERRAKVRARVLREVGIDEAKGKQVEKVLLKYEPERQKQLKAQREYRKTLRDLLSQDSNDDAAYKKALEGLRSAQKKVFTAREKELDELAKLLTAKQQAKLFATLQRMRRQFGRGGGEKD